MTEPIRGNETLNVERRWTISNALSLSRVILLIPVVVLLLQPGAGYRPAAIALMIVSAITDFLDGFLARKLNQVTDFGRLLDPAADKICVIAVSVALVAAGDVPPWFAFIVVLRDLLIVAGSLVIIGRRKIVVQSVWAGKWTVAIVAAYLILATLRIGSLSEVKTLLLYLSTAAICISLGIYMGIYRRHMADGRAI